MNDLKTKKFLIAGANGQLGTEFKNYLSSLDIQFSAPDESEFDITNPEAIKAVLSDYAPDYLINCAAYNLVDQAETDQAKAFKINAEAPGLLADACGKNNVLFIHYSSDYVFDGKKGSPYIEEDIPHPLNIYGQSKLKGEQAVQEKSDEYLIFRLSWVIGPGQQNFLYKLSGWAESNPSLKISNDEISVPTFTADIVRLTLLSIERELKGLYHLVSSGYASRYEMSEYYLQKKGLTNSLEGVSIASFSTKAERPMFSAMSNTKLARDLNVPIPTWQEAMGRFLKSGS